MVEFNLNLTSEQKDLINRIVTRVPRNEEEVKRIFYKLEDVLNFQDVKAFASFPDASALYKGKEINIEFEQCSSNFRKHGHREDNCDLIVCWEDDDTSLKIPVLEFSTLAENWLKKRQESMMKYLGLGFNEEYGEKDKHLSKEKAKIESLMEKYDFDRKDAIAAWMGITKSGLRYYDNLDAPECEGGQLVCEKRDIDPKYLGTKTSQKMVPLVLCKKCQNKAQCRIGNNQQIGYYFLLNFDSKRPRKVDIQRRPIDDEKILSHVKPPHLNLWKDLQFGRR